MVEWIIIISIAVFLVLIVVLPNLVHARVSSNNACINNLRNINAAAEQFALEHHKANGEAINFPTDLTPYIKLNSTGKIPSCPQGGIYSIKKVGDIPTCTLSTATPAHALQ